MDAQQERAVSMKVAFWSTMAFFVLFMAAAVLCLRQWGNAEPWARLDRFSGGYLLLSLAWLYQTVGFHKGIFRSMEVMREASGAGYDPQMMKWVFVVSAAELTVLLDYGHWRLTPFLEVPAIQYLGLVLYAAGAGWLVWVDRHLLHHFAGNLTGRRVMTEGPYRLVRHPRYMALLTSRAAFALIFASVLGWGFVLIWLVLIRRRIGLEEAHMRELFGAEYENYAARTPRLLPWL